MHVSLGWVSAFALVFTLNAQAGGIRNQDTADITVLRATVRYDLKVQDLIDLNQCAFVGESRGGSSRSPVYYRHLNCAWQLADRLGATPLFPSYDVTITNGRWMYGTGETPVIEIETLMPAESMTNATGIGFTRGALGGTVHKWEINQTHEVRKVTLKDGRPGLVHKFVVPFHANGGTGDCIIRTVTFKPFVSYYESWTDTEVRNWDNRRPGMWNDYVVTNFDSSARGCSNAKENFDYSSQLLAQ